jgi:predicted nucleic acid-binding protein
LILSSDFKSTLRRLKPEKRRIRLVPRKHFELPFLGVSLKPPSFLYDTTVYVDVLLGRFPEAGEAMLLAADAWHSTVAESELAAVCALLDPAHVNTRKVLTEVADLIDRIPSHRIIQPDREVWSEAGILTGTIGRLQGISKADRRRILNDALIFASARRRGHTVLTRNVVDFDFLHQLDPSGRVMFYRV